MTLPHGLARSRRPSQPETSDLELRHLSTIPCPPLIPPQPVTEAPTTSLQASSDQNQRQLIPTNPEACIHVLQDATDGLLNGWVNYLYTQRILDALASAPHVSPVEEPALRSLNVQELIKRIDIRHSLNYDSVVSFSMKPAEQGCVLDRYFCQAVSLEIALYTAAARLTQPCHHSKQQWIALVIPSADRLPSMFRSILRHTKDLLRHEDWMLLREALDIQLVMNQLKNGHFDLLGLLTWLGQILKQSCSPMRDVQIDTTVSTFVTAMTDSNGQMLAKGISMLYNVFIEMKLDIANHQMRILLPPVMNESIEFVRNYYIRLLEAEPELFRRLWKWFYEIRLCSLKKARFEEPDRRQITINDEWKIVPEETFPDEDSLTCYATMILRAIKHNTVDLRQLPLQLDLERITGIQYDIQILQDQKVALQALKIISRQCGKAEGSISIADEQLLLSRLSAITRPSGEIDRREELIELMAVELVRTAYEIGKYPLSLPHAIHLHQVLQMLDDRTPAGQHCHETARRGLFQAIKAHVFEEINGPQNIADLLPSQILERYKPFRGPVIRTPLKVNLDIIAEYDAANALDASLRGIANSIAHIVIIQWRIWASLVFFQPRTEVFDDPIQFDNWCKGTQERIRGRQAAKRQYKRDRSEQIRLQLAYMRESQNSSTSLAWSSPAQSIATPNSSPKPDSTKSAGASEINEMQWSPSANPANHSTFYGNPDANEQLSSTRQSVHLHE